ncbi:MAG: hypothetical protein AAGK02_16060 [Pseudomonadota bacterium]
MRVVDHADGGYAEIDMTDAEMRDCANRCAERGDPPCWELPQMASDAPRYIPACSDCRALAADDGGS